MAMADIQKITGCMISEATGNIRIEKRRKP